MLHSSCRDRGPPYLTKKVSYTCKKSKIASTACLFHRLRPQVRRKRRHRFNTREWPPVECWFWSGPDRRRALESHRFCVVFLYRASSPNAPGWRCTLARAIVSIKRRKRERCREQSPARARTTRAEVRARLLWCVKCPLCRPGICSLRVEQRLCAHGEKRFLEAVRGLFRVQRSSGRACDVRSHVQRASHEIPFSSAWGRTRRAAAIDIQGCNARCEGRDVRALLANCDIDVPRRAVYGVERWRSEMVVSEGIRESPKRGRMEGCLLDTGPSCLDLVKLLFGSL